LGNTSFDARRGGRDIVDDNVPRVVVLIVMFLAIKGNIDLVQVRNLVLQLFEAFIAEGM